MAGPKLVDEEIPARATGLNWCTSDARCPKCGCESHTKPCCPSSHITSECSSNECAQPLQAQSRYCPAASFNNIVQSESPFVNTVMSFITVFKRRTCGVHQRVSDSVSFCATAAHECVHCVNDRDLIQATHRNRDIGRAVQQSSKQIQTARLQLPVSCHLVLIKRSILSKQRSIKCNQLGWVSHIQYVRSPSLPGQVLEVHSCHLDQASESWSNLWLAIQ